MAQYPYENKLLPDIAGEEWKPVVGLEDYYHVSNMGRVKSLDRMIKHKSGKMILTSERIISQTQRLDKNDLTGEPTVAMRVGLFVEGKRYDLTVRRMVYAAFVGPLDPEMVIINLDGNGYNNQVENLKMVTKKEKSRRIFERNRIIPSLRYLDRSTFRKPYGGYSRQKPISKYDRLGNKLASYPSIAEAARQNETGEKEIILVAKGRRRHHRGFVWKYDEKDS